MKIKKIVTFTLIVVSSMQMSGQDMKVMEKIFKENFEVYTNQLDEPLKISTFGSGYTSYGFEGSPTIEYDRSTDLYLVEAFVLDKEKPTVHGIFDSDGKCIAKPKYSSIGLGSSSALRAFKLKEGQNSYIPVSVRTQIKGPRYYGVIDNKGNEVLPCRYSTVFLCRDIPVAIVVTGEEFKYDEYGFTDGLKKNGKWGIYDLENRRWLSRCIYEYIDTRNGRSYLEPLIIKNQFYTNKRNNISGIPYFIVNTGGKVKGEFDTAVGGNWGMLDPYGQQVIPTTYKTIEFLKDGNIQVKDNKGHIAILQSLDGSMVNSGSSGSLTIVDTDIPEVSGKPNENTFAFIIGNERYKTLSNADYAINDAMTFSKYCKKTLLIPDQNVTMYEDLSYGNFIGITQRLQDIADAYDGDAKIIVYYSGLGITSSEGNKYLLPIDANLNYLDKTAIPLNRLVGILDVLKTKLCVCIIDAPFNGQNKSGEVLESGRGIAKKSTLSKPQSTVVALAGDNSVSTKELSHSIFTYSLLESIRKNKGKSTIKEMFEETLDAYKKRMVRLNKNLDSIDIINLTDETSKTKLNE